MIFPSKWQIELSTEDELEEDLELTISDMRIVKKYTGNRYFQLKLYCKGDLVFSINTNPDADHTMFIKAMGNEGNRMPWECLLDDANHIA